VRIADIINREQPLRPGSGPSKIPWDDPAFSERMLQEHLSQAHGMASRRLAKIDAQVAWIQQRFLQGDDKAILDLGCGPGLYAERFAHLGHRCVGLDFGPASIRHARGVAQAEGLDCRYTQGDIRTSDYGSGYDLAMLIFGEINVFTRAEALAILRKTAAALKPDGVLLLEPHTLKAIKEVGEQPSTWYSSPGGLLCPGPHLALEENAWCADQRVATWRCYVVEAGSQSVTLYGQSLQAYGRDEYVSLLAEGGFPAVEFYPSLLGRDDMEQRAFFAVSARR